MGKQLGSCSREGRLGGGGRSRLGDPKQKVTEKEESSLSDGIFHFDRY